MTIATFPLDDEQHKAQALRYLSGVKVGTGLEVIVRKEGTSDKQLRRWYSMLGALEKSGCKEIAGRSWDKDGWHDIMMYLYRYERLGERGTVVMGPDGEFISILGTSTHGLDRSQFSDMMAMTLSYIDKWGVQWLERAQYPEDR